MLEKQEIKIYKKDEFVVEVSKSINNGLEHIEFFLYHTDYDTKLHMFGVELDFNNDNEIKDLINKNIEEYIAHYEQDIM